MEMFNAIFEFGPDAIVVVDGKGSIVCTNAQVERMFGHRREELLGQPVEMLVPERLAADHVKHRSAYQSEPCPRPGGAGLELLGKRRDGTEFPVDVMFSAVETSQGRVLVAVLRDATLRKQADALIKEALQREVLLKKEIHHRVKNNLQTISSLLYLQSTSVTHPETQEILMESQSRVKSIALLHEKLYGSNQLDQIDFADYLRDLVTELFRAYRVRKDGIKIQTTIEHVHLGIDTAIPCGLILNELVSNALKHAFPGERKGEVWIDLGPTNVDEFELTVRDDGIGLPKGFDWQQCKSLGLKLVLGLTKQLGGKMEVHRAAGTTFRLTFSELQQAVSR